MASTPNTAIQKPRRGRPKMPNEQREEMRRRIADVAKQLFESEGYGTISLRRIAREVGCTPMALYTYYDAKIDILQTLWDGVFETVFNTIDAVNKDQAPLDYLIEIASAYVAYWIDNPEHYRLVFMADGVTQPEVNAFLDTPGSAARFSVFGEALAKAATEPLEPDDFKLKFDILTCFLHGAAHSVITMSGYTWSRADKMVAGGIRGLITHNG